MKYSGFTFSNVYLAMLHLLVTSGKQTCQWKLAQTSAYDFPSRPAIPSAFSHSLPCFSQSLPTFSHGFPHFPTFSHRFSHELLHFGHDLPPSIRPSPVKLASLLCSASSPRAPAFVAGRTRQKTRMLPLSSCHKRPGPAGFIMGRWLKTDLVGGIPTSLKNISSSIRMIIPNSMEK